MDPGTHSPHLLRKIVHAGAQNTSFASGRENLQVLAGLKISEKQVERLTKRIGQERLEQRAAPVQASLELPWMERVAAPAQAPHLAVVPMDGGRIQILDRQAPAAEPGAADVGPPPAPASPAEPPEDDAEADAEADQDPPRHGHWREDKIGLLMTRTGAESRRDPCPEIPEAVLNPLKIPELVREIKRGISAGTEGISEPVEDDPANPLEECAEDTPPKVRLKAMVGTRAGAKRFGAILAAAAYARGFFGAKRQAFVADGAETNGTTHRRWFREFVPILDFIHALTYGFAAAMAGRDFRRGWETYGRRITLLWQGRVAGVIAALEPRQEELGLPETEDPESHPRAGVAETLRSLRNNQERMRSDAYRRQGLPLVSRQVESTVEQFNRRVKGTEKFGSEPGAEALLQWRADYLSETEPMGRYWQEREATATGRRVYRRSG